MKKWLTILGAILLGALFLYGSLAALVNQGLSLAVAAVVMVLIMIGGVGLMWLLR